MTRAVCDWEAKTQKALCSLGYLLMRIIAMAKESANKVAVAKYDGATELEVVTGEQKATLPADLCGKWQSDKQAAENEKKTVKENDQEMVSSRTKTEQGQHGFATGQLKPATCRLGRLRSASEMCDAKWTSLRSRTWHLRSTAKAIPHPRRPRLSTKPFLCSTWPSRESSLVSELPSMLSSHARRRQPLPHPLQARLTSCMSTSTAGGRSVKSLGRPELRIWEQIQSSKRCVRFCLPHASGRVREQRTGQECRLQRRHPRTFKPKTRKVVRAACKSKLELSAKCQRSRSRASQSGTGSSLTRTT